MSEFCMDCGVELKEGNWFVCFRKKRMRICKECNRKRTRKWQKGNPTKFHLGTRRRRLALRLEALSHYGNGKVACVKCGFSDWRALHLEHIDNNGAEERQRIFGRTRGASASQYCKWLKAHGWPSGLQTMCSNCNSIKRQDFVDAEFAKRYT